MALGVDILRPRELGRAERDAWTAFQARDPRLSGPYFTLGWADLVDSMRSDVRIGVFHDNGRVRGFLGFQGLGRRVLAPLGGVLSDYQAILSDGDEGLDPRLLLKAAGAGRLDFSHILADTSAPGVRLHGEHASWALDLSGGFQAYLARRRAAGSGVAKRIARRRTIYERAYGPVTVEAMSPDSQAFEQLLTWKRDQYHATGARDVLAHPWIDQVVRGAFAARSPNFSGALYVLRAGDRLMAGHFALRSADTLHAWFIAHDPDAQDVSPGATLIDAIVAAEAGGPITTLDLGYGDYRFKQELASGQRGLAAGYLGRPAFSAFSRAAMVTAARVAERAPLGAFATAPSRLLRRLDAISGLAAPLR